jgi:hypothetical protein
MKNKENNSPCLWSKYGDDFYSTSCEQSHVFFDGNCEQNIFKFCPYCGGHIVEVNDE